MQVIFRTDIARVGRNGEVKEVPDGYARNFLIPRGFAERATPERLQKPKRLQRFFSGLALRR